MYGAREPFRGTRRAVRCAAAETTVAAGEGGAAWAWGSRCPLCPLPVARCEREGWGEREREREERNSKRTVMNRGTNLRGSLKTHWLPLVTVGSRHHGLCQSGGPWSGVVKQLTLGHVCRCGCGTSPYEAPGKKNGATKGARLESAPCRNIERRPPQQPSSVTAHALSSAPKDRRCGTLSG